MTNEEILEKQVEALEKLLQLRTAIIEELESKVRKLETEKYINAPHTYPGYDYPGIVNVPYFGGGLSGTITAINTCPDGTPHEYPSMWGGINPPPCNKCGGNTIISTNTVAVDEVSQTTSMCIVK